MKIFKVDTIENAGENWLIADFGCDGNTHYIITTDHVHASEMYLFSEGGKADAELVCRLLNEYYESKEGKELIGKRAGQLVIAECM